MRSICLYNHRECIKLTFVGGYRYLLESTSFEELEDTLEISRQAYSLLRPEDRDQALLAKILQSTALMWAHMIQAHTISCSLKPVDHSELAWSYTDLGNVIGAIGRPEEALNLHLKSLEVRQEEENVGHAPLGIAYQNLARSYCMVGQYVEAQQWADKAVDFLTRSQRWVMVA